jgi:diadenosine tetraphosphatase ApaH/serine/threonine PP2A family protein phosphatase
MRYGIFSDVHSNLEAFSAVIDFFSRSHIDQYLFAGDIVGYGADPGQCIDLLKKLDPVSAAGNHDWAVAGRISTDNFNEHAAAAVSWTRECLGPIEKMFLSQQRSVCETDEFCIVHGTLVNPEKFDYMLDIGRANCTMQILKQELCFVGHTHIPGAFVDCGGGLSYSKNSILQVRGDSRAIIDCGSVGQPRDGDPRACCCIFDSDKSLLTWHRIAYDHRAAGKKIREAGLPESLAVRLELGM